MELSKTRYTNNYQTTFKKINWLCLKKSSADLLTGILNNNSHKLTFEILSLEQKKENSQLCQFVTIIISYSLLFGHPVCM